MTVSSRSVIRNTASPPALFAPADESLGIRHFVRMRNARGVLGDAAIVGERCYRFSVHEARRTQYQPLGLEDGDTGLAKFPG